MNAKLSSNQVLDEYRSEYKRTSGKNCTPRAEGHGWYTVDLWGTKYRLSQIVEMTETLKLRPDHKPG